MKKNHKIFIKNRIFYYTFWVSFWVIKRVNTEMRPVLVTRILTLSKFIFTILIFF